MHQQQQHLDTAITTLNSHHLSPSKLLKTLSILITALSKYNLDSDLLPSERFIPCCLFTIPKKIYQLIGHKQDTFLTTKPQKTTHRLLIHLYLKSILKLLTDSAIQIKHIIIQSMSHSIPLTAAFPNLTKQWLKTLISLWGSSSINLHIPLRCHLTLAKYLSQSIDDTYMWTLRRMYISYFQNSKQVSWLNYEHINFMINSFCEIVKFNPERAYYVLFGYLRSLALQLNKFHHSKRKQKITLITKLFSNQILNCFKLLTAIVSRVVSTELTALVYPLCQIFAAYERVTDSQEYLPLKLHLLEYELTLIDNLNIYIPHTLQLIQKLLNSQIFSKRHPKKSQQAQLNIQLAYKLSKTELTKSLILSQLFKTLITKIYKYQSLFCRPIYGPQTLMKLHKILKSHHYPYQQYQHQLNQLTTICKTDYLTLYQTRSTKKLSLTNTPKIHKYQSTISTNKNIKLIGPQKYIQLKLSEQQLLKNKLAAEQQQSNHEETNSEQQQKSMEENQDQINSGWEQASQGASQLDPKQIQSHSQSNNSNQQPQNISYQGDPSDASEALKQWSESQWSSQSNLNQP